MVKKEEENKHKIENDWKTIYWCKEKGIHY